MFEPVSREPQNAIALIFDLEGFSRFFNQPDVSHYLAAFLNHVFGAVQLILKGGDAYWTTKPVVFNSLGFTILQEKFMGDGALIILLPPKPQTTDNDHTRTLCNRLWTLKNNFHRVLERCADDVPVHDLPPRIRFGLARGSVIELKLNGSIEYVGFCINLASRLQKYCPELGFISSARVGLSQETLSTHGYVKVVATQIRGFPKEIVFVDKDELKLLPKERFSELFADLKKAKSGE
ncbi:hypothetical protein AYO46_00905 [Betaproteobacteria bacterium SCGC AG-212-J23]|nr:hypothetical protein AYO46_00905 [Betaproteobacteria bacterium SCGC AG-212-J23]